MTAPPHAPAPPPAAGRQDASPRRSPSTVAVELRIAGSALRFLAVLALPTLAAAWWYAGREGLNGALVGIGVVAGMFAVSAVLSALAAPHGPAALFAAVLGGYALRLGIYAALIVLLRPVAAIDGPSLAVSAAVVLLATLAYEAWHICRTPQFFWIDPSAAATSVAPERTSL